MTTHRRLGMDWQASVASVAVQAAKAQRRSETASTGAPSMRRHDALAAKVDALEARVAALEEAAASTEEAAESTAATIIDEDEEEV